MALVAYPESDEEGVEDVEDQGRDEDEGEVASPAAAPQSTSMSMSLNSLRQPRPKKRRISCSSDSPPPLPANFHNLYSSSVRVSTSDDPSLHGGRKRIVPHLPGNWAAHVYLECKSCFLSPHLPLRLYASSLPTLPILYHFSTILAPIFRSLVTSVS